MRRRLALLVAATTSVVLLAFTLPLAVLIDRQATNKAVTTAADRGQRIVPTVATGSEDDVRTCVDELNGRLNRWETIKDIRILDHDLTVAADELTPSMKVKRRVVEARSQGLVDEMYAAPVHR